MPRHSLSVLLISYGAILGGIGVLHAVPLESVSRECSVERVRKIVGGTDCIIDSEFPACDQTAKQCSNNSCTGDIRNDYFDCVEDCEEQADADATAWCSVNWSGFYSSPSACYAVLYPNYADNCVNNDCDGLPDTDYKSCSHDDTDEDIQLTLSGMTYVTYTSTPTPQTDPIGDDYCTWRCDCSSFCTSSNGGMTFLCQMAFPCGDEDPVDGITNGLPRFPDPPCGNE